MVNKQLCSYVVEKWRCIISNPLLLVEAVLVEKKCHLKLMELIPQYTRVVRAECQLVSLKIEIVIYQKPNRFVVLLGQRLIDS